MRPGSEEYLDSEKYQYRPRDWAAAAGTLASRDFITELNRIRASHPALHSCATCASTSSTSRS